MSSSNELWELHQWNIYLFTFTVLDELMEQLNRFTILKCLAVMVCIKHYFHNLRKTFLRDSINCPKMFHLKQTTCSKSQWCIYKYFLACSLYLLQYELAMKHMQSSFEFTTPCLLKVISSEINGGESSVRRLLLLTFHLGEMPMYTNEIKDF